MLVICLVFRLVVRRADGWLWTFVNISTLSSSSLLTPSLVAMGVNISVPLASDSLNSRFSLPAAIAPPPTAGPGDDAPGFGALKLLRRSSASPPRSSLTTRLAWLLAP